MNISSVSALSAYSGYSSDYSQPLPYTPEPSSGSKSVIRTPAGATVTTLRGSGGDVFSVTTEDAPHPTYTYSVPQGSSPGIDVTA